jgi:anaerobic dimethyl sulfoxide reductase subunit A
MKRIRETYGAGSLIFRGGGADTGKLHTRKTIERVMGLTGGYSDTWGTISYEGGRFAELATFGTLQTRNSRSDMLNSRLIILWGWDPANSVQDSGTSWFLIRAKEAGAKIISVDPRYTDTAVAISHEWIPIRPGTDAAMLISMAYVMITENLYDRKFVDTNTTGFDKFKDYVLGTGDGTPKTPEWAEAITGVAAAAIEKLAREYASIKPAALIAGIGPGRTAYGEQYHRAAITLAAMTGNIGIHGGSSGGRCLTGFEGFPFMTLGPGIEISNPVEDGAPPRRYALPHKSLGGKGQVNLSQIADAILKGKGGGYPFDYKFLYVMNANIVNQSPDSNKIARAFQKLEFMVVQEQFMTATARYADIVLPVSHFFERNDITIGEGVHFYGYMNKVIEPLSECKSQLEIAMGLADKLGVAAFNKTEDEWLRDIVKKSPIPDYEEFKRRGIYKPEVSPPYVAFQDQIKDPAGHPFNTPSGKIEIYSQQLATMGHPKIPPVPQYIETWESLNDPLAGRYPLQLITTQFKRRSHSQFENIPWLKELQEQVAQMNPSDAQSRNIQDGDEVLVFNDRGTIRIRARLTERIMPGVVDVGEGAWYNPDENGIDLGGCANVLTSDEVSPAGAVPYHTALVQVQKLEAR